LEHDLPRKPVPTRVTFGIMLWPTDNELARLLRASYADELARSWLQSPPQVFRGPAQSFDTGVHLNLNLDDFYGLGRIFDVNDVNDGLKSPSGDLAVTFTRRPYPMC
jgi:hypothetical protein